MKKLYFDHEYIFVITNIKKEILEKLALIPDEPETSELLFKFPLFAKQIKNIIFDDNVNTPFTLAIHGDWGSGKTSLILETERLVKKEIDSSSKDNWHVIRFDAWEYERVDVISALFDKIETEYKGTGSKLTEFGKSAGTFLVDAALRKGANMSLKESVKHFKNMFDEISSIKNKIESLVDDGRLIIFVDDLDRCHIDNVLDMLEAIKMFLTAKNVFFVVAVDMKKIERAWKLRYNSEDGSLEGLEHVEKIFPIKLSLPQKEEEDLAKYVEKMCGSLSNSERMLLVKGCVPNPRKIKRITNLAYFVLKNLDDDEDFEGKLPFVLIWAILTTNHPQFVGIIKSDLASLFEMVIIVTHSADFRDILKVFKNLDEMPDGRNLNLSKLSIPGSWLSPVALTGITHMIENDQNLEKVLRQIGIYFSIERQKGEDWQKYVSRIKPYYTEKLKPFQDVIYHSSLIGN